MKDTIKARNGYYSVGNCTDKRTGEYVGKGVCDGDFLLFVAKVRTYPEYCSEKEGNEAFVFCEKFTTRKGKQFIYWRDFEIDADYITKIPEGAREWEVSHDN